MKQGLLNPRSPSHWMIIISAASTSTNSATKPEGLLNRASSRFPNKLIVGLADCGLAYLFVYHSIRKSGIRQFANLSLRNFNNQKLQIIRILHSPDNGVITGLLLKSYLSYFFSCVFCCHLNGLHELIGRN